MDRRRRRAIRHRRGRPRRHRTASGVAVRTRPETARNVSTRTGKRQRPRAGGSAGRGLSRRMHRIVDMSPRRHAERQEWRGPTGRCRLISRCRRSPILRHGSSGRGGSSPAFARTRSKAGRSARARRAAKYAWVFSAAIFSSTACVTNCSTGAASFSARCFASCITGSGSRSVSSWTVAMSVSPAARQGGKSRSLWQIGGL